MNLGTLLRRAFSILFPDTSLQPLAGGRGSPLLSDLSAFFSRKLTFRHHPLFLPSATLLFCLLSSSKLMTFHVFRALMAFPALDSFVPQTTQHIQSRIQPLLH